MDDLKRLVTQLHSQKYPKANVIFLAGSVIRGEGTKTSDLDLVVVYDSLPNAYRESYRFGDWPVEAFIHDPQTLEYFIRKDASTGVPTMSAMLSEGIELPAPSELSQQIKQHAKATLRAGPPRWETNEINNSRYLISDLLEDIKAPKTHSERYAIAGLLYNAISNHYFRSQGLWSAKGKSIPRRLRKVDEAFADKFDAAFDSAFAHGQCEKLMVLATDVMSDSGGFLFEGFRVEAPKEWRVE